MTETVREDVGDGDGTVREEGAVFIVGSEEVEDHGAVCAWGEGDKGLEQEKGDSMALRVSGEETKVEAEKEWEESLKGG